MLKKICYDLEAFLKILEDWTILQRYVFNKVMYTLTIQHICASEVNMRLIVIKNCPFKNVCNKIGDYVYLGVHCQV